MRYGLMCGLLNAELHNSGQPSHAVSFLTCSRQLFARVACAIASDPACAILNPTKRDIVASTVSFYSPFVALLRGNESPPLLSPACHGRKHP